MQIIIEFSLIILRMIIDISRRIINNVIKFNFLDARKTERPNSIIAAGMAGVKTIIKDHISNA